MTLAQHDTRAGEKLYTEEMNRLSLLQEIEVKSGSSGEESGAYDYRRVPTDTAARSDDDNDDSAGYDDDHDVDVDGEQNQEVVGRPADRGGKGKERDEEPNEEEEETGEGEEVPGEAEALDNPAIQEEAAQTYEGSRERNANMEKFYCLLLVEWGESMLNQARPHQPPCTCLCRYTFTHHCVLCVCGACSVDLS